MAGKKFFNRGCLLLFLLLFLPGTIHGERREPWIAVLLSDSEKAYEEPLRTFTDSVALEVRVFNLQGDIRNDPGLKTKLFADTPSLIFALGAKAAFVAKLWTRDRQDIPVLFAMVINWQRYKLLDDQSNIAGISSEVNPGNQFLNLSILAPRIRRIGVIYSPRHSKEIVAETRKAVGMLGMELVERPISREQDFRRVYRELSASIDGLWVLNDPLIYTLDNMSWVEARCIADRLVCIGQSRNLAEIGLMLSVRPDTGNIGAQAASMVKNILNRGQSPAAIGVMEPLGTNISINLRTAKRVGVELSDQALNLATEVIE
ncbi:MAG: ABC transporter substrate-binding protein [Thermodesulfobacteriota bacterium]